MSSTARRIGMLIAGLAVAALALRARWSTAGWVLGLDGVVLPVDGDSAYHMRRIALTAADFPWVPLFDPQMNWPHGAACHWAPGFDLAGAALVLLSGAGGDPLQTALVSAALPMLLGVALVAAVAGLAALLEPERPAVTALAAATVAALLPATVRSSSLGVCDHHVAEALSMALLAGWVLVGRQPQGWRYELAGAALVFGSVFAFSGAVLYVAVAMVLWTALEWGRRGQGRGWVGSGAPALGLAALGLAGAFGPIAEQTGLPLSFVFPSLLHPALVALAALGAILVRLLLPRLGSPRALLVAGAAGLVLLAAVGVVSADGLSQWLFRRDEWLSQIQEFHPLLGRGPDGQLSWTALLRGLGWLGVASPVLVALATRRLARTQDRPTALAFALWCTALLLLTLLQQRFGRVFATNLALAAALGLPALFPRRPVVGFALLGATLGFDPGVRGGLRPSSAPAELVPVYEAALFLRAEGPHPGSGVLATWDQGHLLHYLGQRPVVANNFGSYLAEESFERVMEAFGGDETGLLQEMADTDCPVLVAGARTFVAARFTQGRPEPFVPGPDGRWLPNPDFVARLPSAATVAAGSGWPGAGVPHLEHLLPVFASRSSMPGSAVPWLYAFERVSGAVLEGGARPGERVVAELDLVVRGVARPWRAWADADQAGRYRIRVPLPTSWRGAGIETPAAFRVVTTAGVMQVPAPEEAVRDGSRIDVPPP